jgi:hypothetical protein
MISWHNDYIGVSLALLILLAAELQPTPCTAGAFERMRDVDMNSLTSCVAIVRCTNFICISFDTIGCFTFRYRNVI